MFIYHIVKFCIPCHGGAEGGASLLNTQMNIRFRKTRFFDLKIAYECDKRPIIAPPCMPKVAPPIRPAISSPHHPPPHDRPTSSLKNMGFSQKWGRSARYVGLQRVTAPPCAPPCFTIEKLRISAKIHPIMIFRENASFMPHRSLSVYYIRSHSVI